MKSYKIIIFIAPGTAAPNLMIGRTRALSALGHQVKTIDLLELHKKSSAQGAQKALNGLTASIKEFNPDAFFSYGATALIPVAKQGGGLMPYLSIFNKPFVSFISCSDMIHPYFLSEISLGSTSDNFFVFSYDSFHIYLLKQMGLKNCALLPLACDTELFKPVEKNKAQKILCDYGFAMPAKPMDVSFIGNLHRTDQMHKMGQHFPNTLDNLTPLGAHKENWLRHTFLSALKDTKLHVFGQRWQDVPNISDNWNIHEFCPYHLLPAAYSYSNITVNMTGADMLDSLPTRVFDAMASGSVVITNKRNCLPELFTPGRDIITIDTPAQLKEAVDYYTHNPSKRADIGKQATKTINSKHRWTHRMKQAIDVLEAQKLLT